MYRAMYSKHSRGHPMQLFIPTKHRFLVICQIIKSHQYFFLYDIHIYLDLPLSSPLEMVATQLLEEGCSGVTHVNLESCGDENNHCVMYLSGNEYCVPCLPSPPDSILLAVLTVSPNRQYLGIFSPTTPATQGPRVSK